MWSDRVNALRISMIDTPVPKTHEPPSSHALEKHNDDRILHNAPENFRFISCVLK
jgi:hypothetical protein